MEKENFTTQRTRKKAWSFLCFLLLFLACGSSVFAQSKTISGIVASAGEPLMGASIAEKGTTNGTITDKDGRFTLSVSSDAALVVSYLGYETTTVHVKGKSFLNIELSPAMNMLDEFVAIGYGVQQKKLITGATVQVKGDDIAKLNTVNTLGALQSQTPGVNITKQSGKPGEGFKVTIRGLGTIGNSAPLYIIDGVPNGDISMLSPSDIESVDVLKDAASAAIYGARAANGVILVTTKQGKKEKPRSNTMAISVSRIWPKRLHRSMPSSISKYSTRPGMTASILPTVFQVLFWKGSTTVPSPAPTG